MKICKICHSEKSLDEFYRDKRFPNSISGRCKKCQNGINKKYYNKNKEKILAQSKERYKKSDKTHRDDKRTERVNNGLCEVCGNPTLPYYKRKCEKHYFAALSIDFFGNNKHADELRQLLKKQDYTCPYSGQKLVPGVNLSLDHKLPKSKFPELANKIENLQFCDRLVNNAKYTMSEKEFIVFIDRIYNFVHHRNLVSTLHVPLSEVIDKFTILQLKMERLPENNEIYELYGIYDAAIKGALKGKGDRYIQKVVELQKKLYITNKRTWELEADIRNGKLDNPENMAEVGKRTIQIRNSNKERVKIKNDICKLSGDLHGLEIKVDHLSA